MISGGGMLDFLACQSAEKLVVDAEAVGMVKRLLAGLQVRPGMLATTFFEGINFKGDFLKQKATRELFSQEQHLPSSVIDRDSVRGWQHAGSLDTFQRAKLRTQDLLLRYERPRSPWSARRNSPELFRRLLLEAGMAHIPELV
jgi:trimethylamine:corrinoid methyltransferase-like protein